MQKALQQEEAWCLQGPARQPCGCSKEAYEEPDHAEPSKPGNMIQLLLFWGWNTANSISPLHTSSVKLSQQKLLEGYCQVRGGKMEAFFLSPSCLYGIPANLKNSHGSCPSETGSGGFFPL